MIKCHQVNAHAELGMLLTVCCLANTRTQAPHDETDYEVGVNWNSDVQSNDLSGYTDVQPVQTGSNTVSAQEGGVYTGGQYYGAWGDDTTAADGYYDVDGNWVWYTQEG